MTYGLLGEHLSHSYSPRIHAMLGSYPYRLFSVAPEELEAFLKERRMIGASAFENQEEKNDET